jgi:hypothetical protein
MTLENAPETNAKDFGIRMARTFLEVKSSNVWFYIQQAYKDVGGLDELEWSDVEELLKRFLAEK